jgi:hypothetical protein
VVKQKALIQWNGLLGIGLLLVTLFPGCASPIPHSQPTYSHVYGYNYIHAPANATLPSDSNYYLLQPGNQIIVTWQPTTDGAGLHALITFFVKLIGPFSSFETANQVLPNKVEEAAPVVVSALPIQIDNWTNVTRTSILDLPSQPIADYYWLFERICQQGDGVSGCVSGGLILRITA